MTNIRIGGFRLLCRDPITTAQFYMQAFGCREQESETRAIGLRLGGERLELVAASAPSEVPALANSTAFQHCAIVVSNMDAAMASLGTAPGWTAISRDGPQHLPAASGGVTAFKFRDPEGHPLELLQFPPGQIPRIWRSRGDGPCLGIDHSAITVTDTDRAIAFYTQTGFGVGERHVNRGVEQARLDDLDTAEVEVTTLIPAGCAPPHLELLCYRTPAVITAPVRDGSPLATSLELIGRPGSIRRLSDPDGHRITVARN